MTPSGPAGEPNIPSPQNVRDTLNQLLGRREEKLEQKERLVARRDELDRYLDVAKRVKEALEQLNEQLFQELLSLISEKLTVGLQEVLEQPIVLRAEAQWKNNSAAVRFWIEREGEPEDIMKGQGGSVANVLSVGLRMFALATLDESRHRRFLVLDEQDCWLHPVLVPRLAKIVRDAGRALGLQVLMVSHHDLALFEEHADRVFELTPCQGEGVRVAPREPGPLEADRADADIDGQM